MRLLLLILVSPFFLISQTQIGNDIDGLAAGDGSGIVSFSGDGTIVAIGGPGNDDAGEDAGHVRVFENSSGDWVQLGNTIYGEAAGDNFGASLSLSNNGSILAIGAPFNDGGGNNAGQVQVFENISGIWIQIGNDIQGDNNDDNFSRLSLSNDGTIVSVNGGYNKSYTRIYENMSRPWTQIGTDINIGPSFSDVVISGDGSFISGDGSVIAISTLNYGCLGFVDGDGRCVFGSGDYNSLDVYKNVSGSWTQIGNALFASSNSFSLSNNGDTLAATSFWDDSIIVYQNIAETWTETAVISLAGSSNDRNINLSSDGSIMAISGYDDTGSETQGFVSIYKNESGTWNKKGDDIIGEGLGDWLHNISLSSNGDKIAIGSVTNDGNGEKCRSCACL